MKDRKDYWNRKILEGEKLDATKAQAQPENIVTSVNALNTKINNLISAMKDAGQMGT